MDLLAYPSNAICSAISSVLGWSVCHLIAWYMGFYVGVSVAARSIENFGEVLFAVPVLALVVVMHAPYFVFAFIACVLLWALPLYTDSTRIRLCALLVSVVASGITGFALSNLEH